MVGGAHAQPRPVLLCVLRCCQVCLRCVLSPGATLLAIVLVCELLYGCK